MISSLSRPQSLQGDLPYLVGCGVYALRWSRPLFKGKCLHYSQGSVSASALAPEGRVKATLQEAGED